MVYAVQATMGFRNEARRDGVMGNVQTQLQQRMTWGEVVVSALPEHASPDPSMLLEVRFQSEAEADAFYEQADAFLGTGVNGPVTGSTLSQHACSHDGPEPQCCVNSRERSW